MLTIELFEKLSLILIGKHYNIRNIYFRDYIEKRHNIGLEISIVSDNLESIFVTKLKNCGFEFYSCSPTHIIFQCKPKQ